jgi:hypothetical protein
MPTYLAVCPGAGKAEDTSLHVAGISVPTGGLNAAGINYNSLQAIQMKRLKELESLSSPSS